MWKNTLNFIGRVGGVVLLICLCWSQAEPLMDAAFAGELHAPGWVILICLTIIDIGCTLGLVMSLCIIIICLICRGADIFRHHLNLILRDAASLRCGR